METDSTQNRPDQNCSEEPTREQQHRAALRLVHDESWGPNIPKEAFAAIYEAAFSSPPAGLKYDDEPLDLAAWIYKSMGTDGDILMRVLAQPFDDVEFIEKATDHPPLIREAHLDLFRAIAIFRLRTEAYYIACDDAEEGEAP